MAKRKKRNNYPSSVGGIKYSIKNSQTISFESTLERDFIYLLEFDCNVKGFEEQPLTIDYYDNVGCLRKYTPDFLVTYKTDREPASWFKPMLVEIKYREDLWKTWAENKSKYKAALRFAYDKGWRFKILTDKEIRTDFLINAKFLLRYRNSIVEMGMVETLIDTINELRVSFPEEIIKVATIDEKRRAQLLYTLWYMISNHMIGCDFNSVITMRSEIWALDIQPPKFLKP